MAEDTPNPVMPPEDPAKIMNRAMPPEAMAQSAPPLTEAAKDEGESV
jgi:hypothetical protein